MVEFFLAKEGIRVRFPLAAPKENTHNVGVFFWSGLSAIERSSILTFRNLNCKRSDAIRRGNVSSEARDALAFYDF